MDKTSSENEENIYVGGHRESFQDPAMDRWVTINSLNSTCNALREVKDRISNRVSIITSTLLSLLSAYFLSIKNWTLMILMFIFLEVSVLLQIKKQIKHRDELYKVKEQIIPICKQYGINVPKGS